MSDPKNISLSFLNLCAKCQSKSFEIEKIYDRELKNLQYLLNFKDMAVKKRDEMILTYVEEIRKLKETINNLNKQIYSLKLQIPDPRNLTLPSNNISKNSIPKLIGNFGNEFPIENQGINNNPNPDNSNYKKRVFSAQALKKNQNNVNVRIISIKYQNSS